jgi:cell division transport system permease protein
MINWLRQHQFALAAALSHVRKAPGSFLFNVLVVAVALALPFAGLTLLDNVRPLSAQLAVEPEISVFMRAASTRAQALALEPALLAALAQGQARGQAQVVFVPREQALAALKSKTGLADVLGTLGENPLPDGYVVKLGRFDDAEQAAAVDAIAAALRALPGVDTVQVDSAWVRRLAALMKVLRLALLLLAATLGLVVVAVVFNTVRLQVLTDREEITVSRLLGATDNFIHRPFYYTGALLGLCAGAVALAAVALALGPLNGAIAQFAALYASAFQLAPLAWPACAALLALSGALGLVGAVLSVQRHLARLR